jgi:FkbM family methyltransferase
MPSISYGQNFEDVLLWRCFGGQETGFWIDIGAWHPTIDSVTRRFYEKGPGWHGVNVEPVPTYFKMIETDRPRDINLQVAIGERSGTLKLTVFEGTGGSSFDPMFIEHFRDRGFEQSTIDVRVRTLTDIFEEHAPSDRPVDFLKIDVEGWEKQAIDGMDLNRFRPRLLIVEATKPNSSEPYWDSCEPTLLANRYRLVWFDGLNRWYAADEHHAELARHFTTPAGVFDDFITAGHAAALEMLRAKLDGRELDPTNNAHATALSILQWKEIESARHALASYKSTPLMRLARGLMGKK